MDKEEQLRITKTVDPIELLGFVNHKKRVHQKLLLDAVEEVLGKETEEYRQIRKLILDSTNDLARSIVRTIFGDAFEGFIK